MNYNFSIVNEELLRHSRTFVSDFFNAQKRQLDYHNLDHTCKVVEAAERIADTCGLEEDDRANLVVAAWFHDVGYINNPENHEAESVKMMRQALASKNITEERVNSIGEIIMSTQLPHNPSNLLCKIICDADMIHLADTRQFTRISEKLRTELNETCKANIDKKEWQEMNAKFLSSHCYFTEYGKKFLRPKKYAILRRIQRKLQSYAGY